jgi:hypothetical protein
MINHRMRKAALELSNLSQQILIDAGTDTRTINAKLFYTLAMNARNTAHELQLLLIEDMRERGLSWADCADAMSTSRQAAWEKFH